MNDLQAPVFNNENSRSSTLNSEGLPVHRALPVVGVRSGGALSVESEHLNVGEVEALLLDVCAAFPGFLECASHGLLSNKVTIVEAKKRVVMDHALQQVEILSLGDFLEPIQELNYGVFAKSDFGHVHLSRGTCCAEAAE